MLRAVRHTLFSGDVYGRLKLGLAIRSDVLINFTRLQDMPYKGFFITSDMLDFASCANLQENDCAHQAFQRILDLGLI